jgi:Ca2+-binding RTX toxin-like protein
MATNYSEPQDKGDVATGLTNLALPSDVVSKILNSIRGGNVDVAAFDSAPSGADIHGNDLILLNTGGTIDLSSISKGDIKGVDAFVFTTNDDVKFDLTGNNTKDFKGAITTGGGSDTIDVNGKKGVTISSGDGNDSVSSASGKDNVNLGSGNDTAKTGDGNDTVSTGAGNDSVVTGSGNDNVFVGSGNDTVSTGDGKDTVTFDSGFIGNAQLNGGGGNDKLDLSSVVISDVVKNGAVVTITLDNGSVITETNFEKFVYDSNGAADGGIVTVGISPFDAHFGG